MDHVPLLLGLLASLIVVTALEIWHDPRKVRIGVYLLALLGILGLWTFAATLDWLGTRFDTTTAQVVFLLLTLLVILGSVLSLGALLVLNGVEVRRRERRNLANSLSLLLGLAILGYVIASIALVFSENVQVMWVLALIGLPFGTLGYGLLSYLLWSSLYDRWMRRWGRPIDAVIVLGAGLRGGRTVTPLLAGRIDIGMRVQRVRRRFNASEPWLVLSGGQGADELVSEAQAMAEYAREQGASTDRIILEDRSRNTSENVRFSQALLVERGGVERVAVATNSYHVFRAATLMRRVGVAGYAVGGRTAPYYWPSAFIREYLAILRDHRWATGIAVGLACVPLAGQIVAWVVA